MCHEQGKRITMTITGWLQIVLLFTLLLALTKPLGVYLYHVFETPYSFRGVLFLEKRLFEFLRIEKTGQTWKSYFFSLLLFNLVGILILFLIEITQEFSLFNPQKLPSVPWDLALNTAVSFVTNTNWQAYSGETTMSPFTQMVGLTWQNFCSAGTGIAAVLALSRGFSYERLTEEEIVVGNFWVDLLRAILFVLLPLSLLFSIFLISQGVIQNFSPNLILTTMEGGKQILPMGPVASQEAIKLLGTNGGGYFNANSAHPFENPTALSNFFEILAFLLIPAALTYTFGRIVKHQKHGWSLFSVMMIMAFLGVVFVYYFESQPLSFLKNLPLLSEGNMEGKELRFGIAGSSLFANLTTGTACGAVNAMHDSFTPLGGMVLLINMLLGEVIFGGVGVGLFGMLMYVLISVFIAGLMVGRTPEYLGKKIEGKEIRFAILYVALYPFLILLGTAWSLLAPYGLSSILNPGPHGLSEILYAYTSSAQNNGSAFAGLNANTHWYNLTLAFVMLMGRYLSIFLGLAIAGSMVNKKIVQSNVGTFPTHGALFIGLLIGVLLIVGALTYFPVLVLGPFTEYLFTLEGKTI